MKEKVCLLRPRKQQQGYPNDTSKKDLSQKWMGKDKRFKNEKMWFIQHPLKSGEEKT